MGIHLIRLVVTSGFVNSHLCSHRIAGLRGCRIWLSLQETCHSRLGRRGATILIINKNRSELGEYYAPGSIGSIRARPGGPSASLLVNLTSEHESKVPVKDVSKIL